MPDKEESEFLEELKEEFLDGVFFELDDCEEFILKFEKSADRNDLLELKKKLHSMKGSAQAVQIDNVAEYLHKLESTIDHLEKLKSDRIVNVVLEEIDHLRKFFENLKEAA